MNRLRRLILAAVLACAPLAAHAAEAPTVAAAADLQAAMPDVVAAYQKATGQTVKVIYGSSGAFTQQIQNGAPFELFLSADESYVQTLQKAGKTEDGGQLYAIGRIGLFVLKGAKLKPDASLKDLGAAAANGRLSKFAIANPDHAPYGRAAREALQSAGVWDAVQPKLVLGENVAQATQFATSGSTAGGIIPLSLSLTPQVKAAGSFTLIAADKHQPLRQRMVLIKGASPEAKAFYAFLQGKAARSILTRYGFTLPSSAR